MIENEAAGRANRPQGAGAAREPSQRGPTEQAAQRERSNASRSRQPPEAQRRETREAPEATGAQRRESHEAPEATGAQRRESREAPGATGAQRRESHAAPGARRGTRPGTPRATQHGTRHGPTGRRTFQQRIGQRAEDVAADFLRTQGLEILERNYRRRLGELDIIARDGDVLIIAEVRTRASDRYGGAAASVDGRKQQRLIRAAAQLLQQRKDFSQLRVRFDVLVVSETGACSPMVQWLQHAFLT